MYLQDQEIKIYEDQGFLFLPTYLSSADVDSLNAELPAILNEDTPRRVLEKDTNIVRSVYGSHTTNATFQRLSRNPKIVYPTIQILGSEVYIHQFKINVKAAFGGDIWEWHRDYLYWQREDGMPTARAINIVVFLDEVNEFNGPLILVPGSHKEESSGSVIDNAAASNALAINSNQADDSNLAWISTVTARLKYSVDQQTLTTWVNKKGMVAPKGPAGSVLLFHANIIHGSAPNMSPFDRKLVIISFNSVENALRPVAKPRPEFLASRDFSPVKPL